MTARAVECLGGCSTPTIVAVDDVYRQSVTPADVSVRGSHGATGSDGVQSEAEMTGKDLSVATILAHYAVQLVAAGWTTEAPAVSQRVAAQYFSATDASGAPWDGVLMATGEQTALRVSLTMHPRGSR